MAAREKNLIFRASIGEVTKAWRNERGLTLAELSQRCDSTITKGYLSQLENNRIDQPNDDHLLHIAKALEIPIEYLLMRRLPGEQDLQAGVEKNIESVQTASALAPPGEQLGTTPEEEGAFIFGSPISSPRRGDLDEEEELLQILAQIEELRSSVKKLIARKKKRK